MAESELHKYLKLALAKALVEWGYQSGVEVRTEDGEFIDVQGKRGKEIINIELEKTHMPDWLIFKIQDAKEIRENLYKVDYNRISKNGKKDFHASKLIESLVETGYFDTESATKYVEKRLGTTGYVQWSRSTSKYERHIKEMELLDSTANDYIILKEGQKSICLECDFETESSPQNECSHILRRKEAIQRANDIFNILTYEHVLSNPTGNMTLDKTLRLEWVDSTPEH